jgi:YHS domain-containing protein
MKGNVCLSVRLSAVLAVSLLFPFLPLHAEGEDQAKAQALCPIMGGPVDRTAYVDYEGKRVYFCCKGCASEFLKDPGKHIQKMESQGIVLERVPESGKGADHRGEGDSHGDHPG